jgi:hypothetical protein
MHPRILAIFLLISACASLAQTPASNAPATDSKECGIKAIQICALHVAQDEIGIVTAPFRMRQRDLPALAVFGAGTGLALATDVDAMQAFSVNPSQEHNASRYSDYAGLYAPAAAVTAGFFIGSAKHNHRLQETSILAEEAMADSFILTPALGTRSIVRRHIRKRQGRHLAPWNEDMARWTIHALRSLHPGAVLRTCGGVGIQRLGN